MCVCVCDGGMHAACALNKKILKKNLPTCPQKSIKKKLPTWRCALNKKIYKKKSPHLALCLLRYMLTFDVVLRRL